MDSKLEKILLLAGGTAVIGAAVWWVWNKYFDEDSDDDDEEDEDTLILNGTSFGKIDANFPVSLNSNSLLTFSVHIIISLPFLAKDSAIAKP